MRKKTKKKALKVLKYIGAVVNILAGIATIAAAVYNIFKG